MHNGVYGKTAQSPCEEGETLAKRLASLSAPQRQAILIKALRAATAVEGEYGRKKVGRGASPHVVEAAVFLSHVLYVQGKGAIRRGWAWQSGAQIEDETGLREYDLRRVQSLAGEQGLGFVASDYDRLRHRKFYRVPCDSPEFVALVEPLVESAEVRARERSAPSVHTDGSGAVRTDDSRVVHADGSGGVGTDGSSSNVSTHVTTDDTPDVINHAPAHAREVANGSRMPDLPPGRDDGDGCQDEVASTTSTSPTPPSRPEEPGKSGAKRAKRDSKLGPRRSPRGFDTLTESILEDALALRADGLSEEAAAIGKQLCRDLGRPYDPDGLVVRLAEECIRKGLPEALGAVAAKASRDDVRSPEGYLRKYIVGEINERKDHMEPGGDPVARFRAARDGELSRRTESAMRRRGGRREEESPARDAEGRRSLVGRSASPVYGVRNPEIERDPEDYFTRRGGKLRK